MNWVIGFLMVCWMAPALADWPSLPFPRNAKVEAVGEDVRLNGVPMRMHRIFTKGNPENVLEFYREVLGEDHKEVKVRKRGSDGQYFYMKILSLLKDEYLITVRVNQIGTEETQTLLAVSDGRPSESTRGLPLGFSLPSESVVLSDMESVDAGKNSRQLVFTNRHSIQANEDLMVDMLQMKGYQLQPKLTQYKEKSATMMFTGVGREAMVVLNRAKGKTSVVMTAISSMKLAEQ